MRKMAMSVVVSVLLGGFTVAVAQLPPDIVADRELVRAERLISEGDHSGALEAMNRIVALQGEHNLALPEEFHFKYAEVALAAGRVEDAVDAVNQYLVAVGREGSFYREALELLDSVEQIEIRAEQIQDQTCTGQPEGAACWMELENQPECHVWNPNLQPDAIVTWTGACVGGLARGTGTLTWVWDSGQQTSESTGRLQEGQRHGPWVVRTADGGTSESFYVEGTNVGRTAEAEAMDGLLVDGKMHGDWVWRFATGTVEEGPFVENQMHGRWVWRFADGREEVDRYVNGEQVN